MKRLATVRRKILANSAVLLLLMAGATLYTGLASYELNRSVEILFRNNLALGQLGESLDRTEASFSEYLRTKSSETLREHIKDSTQLSQQTRLLNSTIVNDEISLLQRDLARVLDTYLQVVEAGVLAKRGRDIAGYSEWFDAAARHAGYARLLITDLKTRFVTLSTGAFALYQSLVPGVLLSNALLVLTATLLGFTLLLRFTRNLTEPLSRLAEAALAVGRGDYEARIPPGETNDEIGTMARSFSAMRESVRRSFDDLRTKAEVERSLLEQRMRVLELDHKLKDAELLALQTQINPHFLFNTLSAGIELAGAEGAGQTSAFLENLAVFIRYALTPPDRFVAVADEIECVRRYVWLVRLRFGGRFSFDVQADADILGLEVPALILQPLVENSVGHGLADRESGGRVTVRGRREGAGAVLTVTDNGVGMDAAERRLLVAGSAGPDPSLVHGIGLRNVIRRILLSTDGRGRVELNEVEGGGLEVRVVLPPPGEGAHETNPRGGRREAHRGPPGPDRGAGPGRRVRGGCHGGLGPGSPGKGRFGPARHRGDGRPDARAFGAGCHPGDEAPGG